MVVSSDDEMEDSDAGPQASPPQCPQPIVDGGAGETRGEPLNTSTGGLGTDNGSGEALKTGLPETTPLRRALPKRIWTYVGR